MKYRSWFNIKGKKWIEVFPQCARDVAMLSRIPSESKTYPPKHDPLVFPDGREQMAILVEAKAWRESREGDLQ